MEATARLRSFGVFCAIGAAFAFSTNDMMIKLMSGDYPLHLLVFVRSFIGVMLTLLIFMPMEGGWRNIRTRRLPLHLARGFCVVFANMTFFASIAALPLADATAIFFVSPMIIAGLSVVFLGEQVGPRRWAAIVVGLIGVLVIVRPTSESFQVAALLPIAAALGYAALHILTRKMRVSESASTMSFYIQITFVIISGGFGLIAGDGSFLTSEHPSMIFLLSAWSWPTAADAAMMAAMGVASAIGGYLITQAYRTSEAGLIAPFEYLALIMAIFWGFVIWGDIPEPIAAVGMAIILSSGLYLALREARVGRRQSAAAAAGKEGGGERAQ